MKENKHSFEVICSLMALLLSYTVLAAFSDMYSSAQLSCKAFKPLHLCWECWPRSVAVSGEEGKACWGGSKIGVKDFVPCPAELLFVSWLRSLVSQNYPSAAVPCRLPCCVTEGKQCLCWRGKMTTTLMRSQPVAFLVANACWPEPLWLVSRSKRTEQWNSCYLIYYRQTWEGKHDDCSSSMWRSCHKVEGNSCSLCPLSPQLTMALNDGSADQTSGCVMGSHTAFGELLFLKVF